MAVGDVELDLLTSQEKTERWITLKEAGSSGVKVSYLRFRTLWVPTEKNREPAPAQQWDGSILFTDGTEDAGLTTMIQQRGKAVFDQA